ncbi:MAG TPA: S16 family serine protease [Acidimicrobiales bacterium]|nr:S16 family serine protease [Acidimicrobiales bacterium]
MRTSGAASNTVVIVVVLLVAGLFVPLPLFVLAPGSAISVGERVSFGRGPDELSGQLLLTTVRIFRPNALGVAQAWLSPAHEVLTEAEVVPEGVDPEQFEAAQRDLFRESSEVAAAVGLRRAGEEVEISGGGARVSQLFEGSPAARVLQLDDVIISVDGEPVELASDLVGTLGVRGSGDEVVLGVRRDGSTEEVRLTLATVEGLDRPGLGVGVTTVDLDLSLPFPVEVDQGEIGGPSAGLMIALTVYDLAEPGDLTAGRRVAGTGTIDLDGQVGPVGGVDAKVVAARAAGATVFLVPEYEASLAREVSGDDLEVVPVATLDDAVAALAEPR